MNSPAVNTIVAWLDAHNIKSYKVFSHKQETRATDPSFEHQRSYMPPSFFVSEGKSNILVTLPSGNKIFIRTHPWVTKGRFAVSHLTHEHGPFYPENKRSRVWKNMDELGDCIKRLFGMGDQSDQEKEESIKESGSVQQLAEKAPVFDTQHIEESSKMLSEMEPFQTEPTVSSTVEESFNQMETKKMIMLLESVKADKEIMEIARNWNTITPTKLGMLLFELHCTLEQHRRFGTVVKEMIAKELNKRDSK